MTLKEFMEKPDSAVLAEAAKCGSVEELKGFFASHGVSVTDDEGEKLYALMSKTKMTELSDEDLDGIAGGGYYWEIYDCPREHTTITDYLWIKNKIADENCLNCQFVKYLYDTDSYVCRHRGEQKWAGGPFEW